MARVDPDAAPQQFKRRSISIARRDARATEFEKALLGMAREHRGDIEFARAVKSEMGFGDLLSQQAVSADHLSFARRGAVEYDQMIAGPIEGTYVAPYHLRRRIGRRAALFEEDAIAQPLRAADFLLCNGEPQLQRTDRPEAGWQALKIAYDTRGRARKDACARAAGAYPTQFHGSASDSHSHRGQSTAVQPIYDNAARWGGGVRTASIVSARRLNSTGLTRNSSIPAARHCRRSDSIALAVSAMIGIGRAPASCSTRRMIREASQPSRPGILISIKITSKRCASPRAAAAPRLAASLPSRARTTSKPNRRSAFCVIVALMSLSSASKARIRGFSAG